MDNRPIGFFDSGLGGLTCIPYLMKELPNEHIIYFGDTARTPYGSKSKLTITNFSKQIVEFLVSQDVKMIVIACNTVSATCLLELQEEFKDIPILGIIQPTAKKIAEEFSEKDNIGVIGTRVTVKSKAYEKIIRKYNETIKIKSKECPAFVPLIEEGIIENEIMELTIRYYLDTFISENHLDTLVLGCTHYPFIRKNIEEAYPDIEIINPSEEIFHSILETLEENESFAGINNYENKFYASDLSENFVHMIDRVCEKASITVAFKSFDV